MKQQFGFTGVLTAYSMGSQIVLEIEQVHILPFLFPARHVWTSWQANGADLNCNLAEKSLITDHGFPFSMCQQEWESLGIAQFLQTTKGTDLHDAESQVYSVLSRTALSTSVAG